jgi:IS30 family transposase
MDTVYNNVTDGPFLQTFKWLQAGFFFMVYHDTKTADDMDQGIFLLEEILGPELFSQYCSVVLTDRGSEFVHADKIEKRSDGSMRTRVFYCDPMASCQKGTLEQEHETLRCFLPKNTETRKYDFRVLGLVDQTKANIILNHINSYAVESLQGKTPIEMTRFIWPKFWSKMSEYGIKEIDKDKVILSPSVLKSSRNAQPSKKEN